MSIYLGNNKINNVVLKTDGSFKNVELTFEERLALANMELAKKQLSYMCRYDTPNGGVTYELAKDKKNEHDDMAYTIAEGAFALAMLRRTDLLADHKPKADYSTAPLFSSSIDF